jgi:Beta-galactosidase
VATPDPKRFSLGVNYRPFAQLDASVAAEDFAHMAQLGLDALRVFVPWARLQPQPERIDSDVLDRLVALIEQAQKHGLRVLPSLTGSLDGEDLLPRWAHGLPNLYAGPLLDAQVRLAVAVAERLREHAGAIVAWDIGHEFSRIRPPRAGKVTTGEHGSVPVSEQEVAAWSKAVAQPFRAARIPVTAGTWQHDLTTDTNVRFGSLCTPFGCASMQAATPLPFGRGALDPETIPFLAMVTAAFSFKPVLMTSVVCEADDEHASLASALMHRLHADGRLGAYWSHWRDDDRGVIRIDGTERPVAGALTAFAKTSPVVQRANDMPMISSTYYYRTLPDSITTLYDAFLGFVEGRRMTV